MPPKIEHKTQEKLEVNREKQRDNYSLAAAFLPLIAVVLWLGIMLINALVIDKSENEWEATVAKKKKVITDVYSATMLVYGELVTKTNYLAGVIEKDIQPEEVFILVETLFPTDPGFTVTGFGRDKDGSFNVTVSAPTFLKFTKIARRFSSYDKIKDVQVRNVSLTKSNTVDGTINFFFISADLNSATKSKSTGN